MWIFKHISDNKIDKKIGKSHSQTPVDIDDIIIRIAVYSKIIRGLAPDQISCQYLYQFHWKNISQSNFPPFCYHLHIIYCCNR